MVFDTYVSRLYIPSLPYIINNKMKYSRVNKIEEEAYHQDAGYVVGWKEAPSVVLVLPTSAPCPL